METKENVVIYVTSNLSISFNLALQAKPIKGVELKNEEGND